MRRFFTMLPLGVAVLAVLVGFFVAAPNAPAASAYPTALQNFNAPTAWSDACVFPQHCHAGKSCWVGNDPFEGCAQSGLTCHGCYI